MRAVGNLVGFIGYDSWQIHYAFKKMQKIIWAAFPKSILPTVFSTIFLAHDCIWETQATQYIVCNRKLLHAWEACRPLMDNIRSQHCHIYK